MTQFNRTFWLMLTSFIVVFVLVNILITKPIVEDLMGKYKDLKSARSKLTSLEKEKSMLTELKKNETAIDDMYNKISTFLPESIKSDDFALQLEDIAFKTNQNQTEITIKTKTETVKSTSDDETAVKKTPTGTSTTSTQSNKGMEEVTYSLNQVGGFEGLVNYLEDMEKMSRLNTFSTLSIASGTNNQVITKIEGSIYFKKQITIDKTPENLNLSSSDITQINNLEHFGAIVPMANYDNINYNRSNPFLNK